MLTKYEKWTTGLFPLHSQPPNRRLGTKQINLQSNCIQRARTKNRAVLTPYMLARSYSHVKYSQPLRVK